MKEQDNQFDIYICEHCAVERQLKIDIFRLKRGRARSLQPCLLCKTQTNQIFSGIADSEKEVDLIKSKIS